MKHLICFFIVLLTVIADQVRCELRILNEYGENYDWQHSSPDKIYLVFNGFSSIEANDAIKRLKLHLNNGDVENELGTIALRDEKLDLEFLSNLRSKLRLAGTIKSEPMASLKGDYESATVNKNNDSMTEFLSFLKEKVEDVPWSDSTEIEDGTQTPTLRAGLDCGKGASKACAKACKSVLKNVCDTYKCSGSLKSMFKRECTRNCRSKFNGGGRSNAHAGTRPDYNYNRRTTTRSRPLPTESTHDHPIKRKVRVVEEP